MKNELRSEERLASPGFSLHNGQVGPGYAAQKDLIKPFNARSDRSLFIHNAIPFSG
jgi:hypothetical protein